MDAGRVVHRLVPALGAAVLVCFAAAPADGAKPRPGPRIVPPANVTVEATGPGGAIVVFRAVKAVGAVSISYSKKSGTRFPLGTTVVKVTAKDRAGRIARASFKVRVVDTTPPTLTQPADVGAEATSITGATVSYTVPAAVDVVSGNLSPACSPSAGRNFPLGATTVTCTVADRAGNRATVTFVVRVVDTTPPVIAPKGDVTASATSAAGANVTYWPPSATDAATAVVTVTCSPTSGSIFPVGTTVVTCTAGDASGNTATATFKVTVTPMPATPGSYSGTTSQGKTITFTVSSDGTQMTSIRFDRRANCADGSWFESTISFPSMSIAADGSFSKTATGPASGAGMTGTATVTLNGRFVTATSSASGAFDAVTTLTSPVSTTCTSGTITWTANRVG